MLAGSVVAGSLLFSGAAWATNAGPPSSDTTDASLRHAHVVFTVRLEDQLLAGLRYLPLSFRPAVRLPVTTSTTSTTTTSTTTTSTTTTSIPPTTTTTATTTTTSIPPTTTTTTPVKISTTKIQKGVFVWKFGSLPGAFKSQWSVGTNNVILQGALMRFQSVNNLPTTGNMDTTTWNLLISAATKKRFDPMSYNVVYVTKGSPEQLKLFVNGHVSFTTLVNTGISVMPTQNGTFPVYLRYVTQTMSGTNPNGSRYSDPGIPWVSYFNGGDALHGFLRSSYGWPQSLGCVEMPFANAAVLWPRTPIGTLVTVNN